MSFFLKPHASSLTPQAPGLGVIPVRVTQNIAKWWNGIHATLRTSRPIGLASSTLALATSSIAGAAGAQWGFISPTSPARYRDLQLS